MPMVGEETCGVHVGAKKRVCNDAIGRPTGGFSPEDTEPQEPEASELEETDFLLNITDGRQFANAVLNSRDFRQYIVYGLRRRDIPPTLLIRLMDYAEGWGKPPERVEIDAKVEAVTEVRRVVIRVDAEPVVVSEPLPPALTH